MADGSSEKKRRSLHITGRSLQYGITVVILLIVIILSISVFTLLRKNEHAQIVRDFDRATQDRISAIKNTLRFDLTSLEMIQSFFEASTEVERSEFEVFVNPLLQFHPSILAFEWVPRVKKDSLDAFLKTAAHHGYSHFTVHESNATPSTSNPPPDDDIFPVFFVQPQRRYAARLGSNLASIPTYRQAMNAACETEHSTMAYEVAPDAKKRDHLGVCVFLPLYRQHATLNNAHERRENLQGFVVGTFNPKGIVHESLASLIKVGISIQVFETSKPDEPRLLYTYWASLPQQIARELPALPAHSDFRNSEELEIAGERLTIVCTATPQFVEARMTWYPWIVTIGILLLTGLLGAYLLAVVEQNAKTNRLANQLTLANRHLEKEIADRKQAEAMSWSNELKYKTLYDASADAILILTPEEEFLNGNHSAATMFRCKSENDFMLLSPTDLSPEFQPDGCRSSEKARKMIDTAIRDGSHHFEWIHRRLDGKDFLASVTLRRMEFEQNILLLSTIRDITEQRRYEDALRESENRYRQLFDQNADAIFIADLETRDLVDCNRRAESLTGYSRSEILALRADQLHPRDQRTEALKAFETLANGAPETSLEIHVLNKLGRTIPVLISAAPINIGDKQFVMGVFADISEQKQAEAKQKKLIQRLEGVNHLQEELLLPGSLAKKLHKITEASVALLDLDFCRIWRIEPTDRCSEKCPHAESLENCRTCSPSGRCLHLLASSGRYSHLNGNHSCISLDDCNLGCVATGEENKFITNSATSDPRISDHSWAKNLGLVSFAAYKLRDTDGQPIGVLAMFAKHAIDSEEDAFLASLADATSRVIVDSKAEEMLRKAERQLRLTVENVSDVIWTVNLAGQFTYATPSSEKCFGYTPDEMLQQTIDTLPTPASSLVVHERLQNLVEQSQYGERPLPEIVELEIVRKDGTTCWGEVTYGGTYDEAGQLVGVQGVYRDVKDRKQIEHERALTTQRMEAMLELNHKFDNPLEEISAKVVEDSIRLTDSQIGYLAMVNEDETVLTMQYWSKSANDTCRIIAPPPTYQLEATGLWGEAVRQRKPIVTNNYANPSPYKRGLPEGHVPLVRHMNIPIFEGNRIVAVAGVGNKATDYEQRDVNQLQLLMDGWWRIVMHKRFEEQLIEARRQAEVANQAKSRFLAAMSHEIRTPMTAILGYADMLMDPTVTPSNRNNYSATIRRSGEHLLTLINDILDLSKIEAGKMTLDVGRCNVVSLLAEVASVVRPRAESHGVSFSIEYVGEIPETILTDGARLRQAIINLAGNAVKFTEKGSVRIVIALCEMEGDQPGLKIDVIDTGIGIHPEILPQLFQPFYQGDAAVSKKFGGTGLGLVISHHLATMLGGQLIAQSTLQQGSTFTLIVPTGSLEGIHLLQSPAEVEHEPSGHSWPAANPQLRGLKILLAEDGFDNRELIQAILIRSGAKVTTAENGRQAVDKATAEPFGVILMDMNMPEMDGYEATSVLRDRGYTGPIFALTANAMSEDRERCHLAGCDEYLTKPIDRVHLIQTIARFAGRDSASESAKPQIAAKIPDDSQTIISEYIDDPEMTEIIRGFVGRLDGHKNDMRHAFDDKNFDDLRQAAHKLKGAGGSYGYPRLTEACRELEDAAKAGDELQAKEKMDTVIVLIHAIENGFLDAASTGTPS